MTVGVVAIVIAVIVVGGGVVAVIVAVIVVVGGVISLALKYRWWDLFNDVLCKTH